MTLFSKNNNKKPNFTSEGFAPVCILLSIPLLAWIPLSEPFILGTSSIFFLLVSGMGLMSLWDLAKKKSLYVLNTALFQILGMGLCYWFARAAFMPDTLLLLKPFALIVLFFYFMVHAEKWDSAKGNIRKLSPWICLFCLGSMQISKISFLTFLELFGHPQFAGAWLLLLIPIFLGEVLTPSARKITWLALISSICFLLVWSHSQFLSLLTVLNIFFGLKRFAFSHKSHYFYPIVILLALGIFFLNTDKISTSFEERFYLWKTCLSAPVAFFGGTPFENHFQTLLNADLTESPSHFIAGVTVGAEWAHNEGIQLLMDYGFPGLVLGMALVFLVLRRLWEFHKNHDPRFWFYGGLVNLILYSSVSFPFHMPCSGIFSFSLLVGLIFEDKKSWIPIKFDTQKSSNFLFLEAGLVAVLCLCILSSRNALALEYFTKGIRKIPLKISLLEKCVDLDPNSKLYTFALAKAYLDVGRLPEAEYWFSTSCQIVPGTAAIYGLAVCKDLTGNQEQAKDLYETVRRMDPLFSPATHNLLVLQKRMEMTEEAKSKKESLT